MTAPFMAQNPKFAKDYDGASLAAIQRTEAEYGSWIICTQNELMWGERDPGQADLQQ